jgi:hypothetical protein
MKNTEKKNKKFQLESFEVAKIKNLKSVYGGGGTNGGGTDKTQSTKDCGDVSVVISA